MVKVPATKDLIQEVEGNREILPEIRVWCHPHRINEAGDDYYYVFPTFLEALDYIQTHPEAENDPLVAFKGYELNLWAIPTLSDSTKEEDE